MDDPIYHRQYVNEAVNTVFEPGRMTAIYQALHTLIRPYALAEQPGYTTGSSSESFDAVLTQLITHVNARYAAAQTYIESQPR